MVINILFYELRNKTDCWSSWEIVRGVKPVFSCRGRHRSGANRWSGHLVKGRVGEKWGGKKKNFIHILLNRTCESLQERRHKVNLQTRRQWNDVLVFVFSLQQSIIHVYQTITTSVYSQTYFAIWSEGLRDIYKEGSYTLCVCVV